ncbi:MAG: LuxR C-terminal-related transcriptional regulator [Cyanobacteria bacterium P01_A01_bin.45]
MNILELKKLVAVSDTNFLQTFDKELLLKFLIEQVIDSQTAKRTDIEESEADKFEVDKVIFESDIDGEHYCVVRCRPSCSAKIKSDSRPKTVKKSKVQDKALIEQSSEQISLSPREKAIAKLVAQGLPNKSIGLLLQISPWTVATHLRRIFGKLRVSSRTAMITRILEEDLLHK